jgi:hypothetical protein
MPQARGRLREALKSPHLEDIRGPEVLALTVVRRWKGIPIILSRIPTQFSP